MKHLVKLEGHVPIAGEAREQCVFIAAHNTKRVLSDGWAHAVYTF
jgi:hypothetical protein